MADLSTRQLILNEARTCFANQGFEGTSLNDIAAGVGIRRPSLLHYFPGKEAIYRQVLADALTDWGDRTEVSRSAGLDGWDKVDRILETSFEFFRSNPDIVRMVRREALTEVGHLGFNLGSALQPYYTRAVAFFEREMAAGTFRTHDAEHLVLTGYGALLTYFSDSGMLKGLLEDDPYSPAALEARYEHLKGFMRSALQPIDVVSADNKVPAPDLGRSS